VSLAGYHLGPGHALTTAAAQWPVLYVRRVTEAGHARPGVLQAHLVCADCGQSVCCLTPGEGTGSYALTAALIMSGVLAHLKRSHEAALPPT